MDIEPRWQKNFTNIPEEIEEQRPDLVLLDISLPSEDGIMLCSKKYACCQMFR